MDPKATRFCELVFTPPDPKNVPIVKNAVDQFKSSASLSNLDVEVRSDDSHVRIKIGFYPNKLVSATIPNTVTGAICDFARVATQKSFAP
jgi:hypothetical protein